MKKKKKNEKERKLEISLGLLFMKSLCKMDSMHEISLVTFRDKIAQYFTLGFRIYFLTEYTIFWMDFIFCSLVWFGKSFL